MVIKRIVKKKGWFAIDFDSDPLGYQWTKIKFRKSGRLGKLLKSKSERITRVPKGYRVIKIENHKPSVGSVTITYEKIKGRKPRK